VKWNLREDSRAEELMSELIRSGYKSLFDNFWSAIEKAM
jgi:hypothetical protein